MREQPEPAFALCGLGGVRAHHRRERAELDPACVEFRLDLARHVPAEIVAPITVQDVARRGGEPWLELERTPGRVRVAGESHRVAAGADAAEAAEAQRAVARPAMDLIVPMQL